MSSKKINMDKEAQFRIPWVDALRGLGMIFVIIGHMAVPEIVRQAIFSFHMPLFFFLSGYLYKGGYSRRWILKKLDSVIMPYLVYSWIMCLCVDLSGKGDLFMIVEDVVLGNGVGVTWFLTCLFVTEVIGGFIVTRQLFSFASVKGAIIGTVAVLGWILPEFELPVVMKSSTVLPALVFWLLGYVLRNYNLKFYYLFIAMPMMLLFVVQRVDMSSAEYGNGFLFYGTAMGSIITLIWGFRRFSIQWKPLSFIGRRSLEFMCLHAVIPMVLTFIVARS